jgi:phasin
MASSPKKGQRPAIKMPQPPLAAAAPEPPAYPVADVSTTAMTAELSAPAVEASAVETPAVEAPVVEAPVVEAPVLEAPVAEFVAAPEAQFAPPAAEVEALVAPEIVETPAPVVPPPPVEDAAPAPAPAASMEAVAATADFKDYGDKARALIEKGLVESRAKFAQVKTVAEEASSTVEASYDAARDGVVAFNVRAIEALKAGANANFDLLASLASAKSISELVTLQSEFARKQFEETSAQAKALAELAGKVANDTVAPFKAHVARTFKTAV